jgi:hypothetical protein
VIRGLSDLGGYTLDLIARLLPGACGSPIYHPRQFHAFWRLPSSRMNYWALKGFRRVQN